MSAGICRPLEVAATTMRGSLHYRGHNVDDLIAHVESLRAWKDAVMERLGAKQLAEHQADPRRALDDLIAAECKDMVESVYGVRQKLLEDRPLQALRERFEREHAKKAGHVARSPLKYRRGIDGRYSNRALQILWKEYRHEHRTSRAGAPA